MANQQNYDYEEFDLPYNQFLERTDSIPSVEIETGFGEEVVNSPGGLGDNVIDGQSFGNISISSWMKSQNYKPKVQGFQINGRLGYIECMQLYVGSGGIVGGSLDIPDTINPNSFHVASDGTTWWGANNAAGYSLAPAYVLPTGDAVFTSVTIHGRDGQALADAINSSANLVTDVINSKLDTQAEEILGDYTFGGVGSIAIADDVDNGVWLSPTGILGKKAGSPTFTITTSGDATFYGELSAAYGTFGTITAGTLKGSLILGDGTTTAVTVGGAINATGEFINDLVNDKLNTSAQEILADFDFGTTDYAGAVRTGDITWDASGNYDSGEGVAIYRGGIVGADGSDVTFSIDTSGDAIFKGSILAGTSIAAPTITGGTITGAVVRAGTYSTEYMELGIASATEPYLRGFSGSVRRMQLDKDSLEIWNASSHKTLALTDGTVDLYKGIAGDPLLGSLRVQTGECALYATFGNLMTIRGARNNTTAYPVILGTYNTATTSTEIAAYAGNNLSGEPYLSLAGDASGKDSYLNFDGGLGSSTGFGIRNDNGVMEYKDSGGSWTAFSSGGGITSLTAGLKLTASPTNPITGSSGTISHLTGNSYEHLPFGSTTYQMLYHAGSGQGAWTNRVYLGGDSSRYLEKNIYGRIGCSADFEVSGSVMSTGNFITYLYTGAVFATRLETQNSTMEIVTNRYVDYYCGSSYNHSFYRGSTQVAIIDDNVYAHNNFALRYGTTNSYGNIQIGSSYYRPRWSATLNANVLADRDL